MSKFLNMSWRLKGIEALHADRHINAQLQKLGKFIQWCAFKKLLRVFWIVVQAEIHKISSETLPFKFC
jgi:hypothetical protein